jgi:hypothetical protein
MLSRSTAGMTGAAVVLLVLAGAGCGGGSADRHALGKAFENRAVSVCNAALAQKKAQGAFPYPNFNPTRPDRSKLPGIARFEATGVKIYEEWLRKMQALGRPPMGRTAWADVLKAQKGHVRVIVEQQAAAERGDGRTFTKDYYEGNKVQDEMVRAADAAGVPVCAAAAAA